MQVTKNQVSPTKVELTIAADQAFLDAIKDHVLGDLAKTVNLAGFRKGHAPKHLIEKQVDQATLQSQFLDHAVNDLYVEAVMQEKLRPVDQPAVEVTKFVPFTALEIKVNVETVGKVTLPDYKKIKVEKKTQPVTTKDVDAVLEDLCRRDATKKEVDRAAKDGDEVVIDFAGVDPKTKEAIAGASGTDYPLTLGSGTFIPGFEPELVGLKAGEEKTFDITFPEDYGVPALQGKVVSFTVTVKKVRELELAKLDDAFAATVGPFKTLAELKADIKTQLQTQRADEAQRAFENELLGAIAEKAKADIPQVLIDNEIEAMEEEERRNLMYRGQTWQEHLDSEGKTAEEHKAGLREAAEARVKTGLVLGEISEAEAITVEDAELDARIAALKAQYNDTQMQAELDKPENRREIRSRLLTEKTIAKLTEYASK